MNIGGEGTLHDLDNGYENPSFKPIEMDERLPLENKDEHFYNPPPPKSPVVIRRTTTTMPCQGKKHALSMVGMKPQN